ncbi:hypothetical protein CXF68_08190 [Tenacibaculum sp. Bg11-29]|uniref:hypothetical protein n=1 Tax=Tenacibaculum sp. Bg11-29 TaxID=2058306 RepID=UPI000C341676|nr:hypothetical protein [Tenacibaculum sp. Bg11-29]PKH50676.1 hypothetical protein CXF68_08190 [Tenacibaculum sp. Bg11-29]
MKKSILKIGEALNKAEQKLVIGGNNCDYYARINLCFATDDPYCIPCNQINNYPGAANCHNIDNGCFE